MWKEYQFNLRGCSSCATTVTARGVFNFTRLHVTLSLLSTNYHQMLARHRRKSLSAEDYSLGSSSPVQPSTPPPPNYGSYYSPRIASSSGSSPSGYHYGRYPERADNFIIIKDKRQRSHSTSSVDDEPPLTSDYEMDRSSSIFDADELEAYDEDDGEDDHVSCVVDEHERRLQYAISSERGLWAIEPVMKLKPLDDKYPPIQSTISSRQNHNVSCYLVCLVYLA